MDNITPFAMEVYKVTKMIPKGKVTTYGAIAKAIGKPKACQAVGAALSINPFAPVVPCHRVISSNCTIGGFFGTKDVLSTNVKKKIKLLFYFFYPK